MANCGRKRIIAAIMALAIVAGAAPAKPISDLIMPELSVSAAEATTSVSWKEYNVEAGGKLGVKFYLNVADNFAYANTAYVKVTCAGVETKTPIKDLEVRESDGTKIVPIYIAAKQMTDDITVEVYANTSATTPITDTKKTVQVKTYLEYQAKNATKKGLPELAKALLNYGAYAQVNFGYNTSKLANAGLDAADQKLASVSATDVANEYVYEKLKEDADFGAFTSISATLESETELNVFFVPKSTTATVNSYNYSCTDGLNTYPVEVEKEEDGDFKLKVKGVAAKALGKDLIVSVSSKDASKVVTLKCSVNTYVMQALQSTNTKVKNAATALYLYNQAAVNYFGAERTVETTITGTSMYINNYAKDSKKAFLETTLDEEGNSVERFFITVPAEINKICGVSEAVITYITNNKLTTIESKYIDVYYDNLSGVTTIAIDKEAVPADVELMVTAKVSTALGFVIDNDGTINSSETATNLKASNEKPYFGEEFVTYLSTTSDSFALPAEIKVYAKNSAGVYEELKNTSAITYFTYDSTTGKVVVSNPSNDIMIVANAVNAHTVSKLFTNLSAEVPTTVGDGFSVTISSDDDTKYRVPETVTLYGSDDDEKAYYSKLNEDGITRTYYYGNDEAGTVGAEVATDYTGVTVATVGKPTAAEKEAAQLNTLDDITGLHYIMNFNADGTAKLDVNDVDSDLVIVATAIEFFDASVTGTNLYVSSEPIGYKTLTDKTKEYNPKAVAASVDKGDAYGPIYFALNTDDKELILPTSVKITMGGKVLSQAAGDYTLTTVKAADLTVETGYNAVDCAMLTIPNVKGEIKVEAAATEQFSVTTKLTGLGIDKPSGTYSVGDFEAKLSGINDYVLPTAIKVVLNDKELTAGLDYTYDSTTGEIVVYGTEKGDKLVITAAGVLSHEVTFNTSTGITFLADSQKVLGGTDYECTIVLPELSDADKTAGKVMTVSEINITSGTKTIDDDSTKDTYYVYDAKTGKLTVKNVSGPLNIEVDCAYEYDVTVKAAARDTVLNSVTLTLDDATVHENAEYSAVLTVSDATKLAGYAIAVDAAVTVDGDSTETITGDVTIVPYTDEDGAVVDGKFTVSIPEDKVTGDVTITLKAVPDTYEITSSGLKNLIVQNNSDYSEGYTYGKPVTLYIKPNGGYELPDSLTVKMNGKAVEGAYEIIDEAVVEGQHDYTGKVTIPAATGDITLEGVADYAVTANAEIDDISGLTAVAKLTDGTDLTDDTTEYNAANAPISVVVGFVDTSDSAPVAYMYNLATPVVTINGDVLNLDKTTYDANVLTKERAVDTAEYALSLEPTNATLKSNLDTAKAELATEKAKAYYTYASGLLNVYNATDKVEIEVTVNEKATTYEVVNGSNDTLKADAYLCNDGTSYLMMSKSNFETVTGGVTDLTKITAKVGSTTVTVTAETVKVDGVDTIVAYKISGVTAWSDVTLTVTTSNP